MRNGWLTERSLARQLGISQSHINNVLRRRRNLSPELADLILSYLNSSLFDLYSECELYNNLDYRRGPQEALTIPVLKRAIGPARPWSSARVLDLAYEAPPVSIGIPECAVLARIAPDLCMSGTLYNCDIALLDLSLTARLEDCASAIFVVERRCECRTPESVLRWIRGGFGKLYVANEHNLNHPVNWEALPVVEEQRLQTVRARVIWLGNETALKRARPAQYPMFPR